MARPMTALTGGSVTSISSAGPLGEYGPSGDGTAPGLAVEVDLGRGGAPDSRRAPLPAEDVAQADGRDHDGDHCRRGGGRDQEPARLRPAQHAAPPPGRPAPGPDPGPGVRMSREVLRVRA